MTAFVNKWQTVLLTSWKWQALVGGVAVALLLLLVLLVRWRRKRRAAADPDLMFGAPDGGAEQPTVSFRDDWADAYVEGPAVDDPVELPQTGEDPAADTEPAVANEAWLTAAPDPGPQADWEREPEIEPEPVVEPEPEPAAELEPEQAAEPDPVALETPAPPPAPSGEVELRVAKLEAAILALTDLLRPAPAVSIDADVGERLDALEQTITSRFDALARTLTNLPPGAALPGATADPEAVAAAVIEIRRTLKG